MSASLAFYSLLSLVPLITVALRLAAWFFGSASARHILAMQVSETFGDNVSQALRSTLIGSPPGTRSVFETVAGAAVILFGASGVTGELRTSLNLIWGAPACPESWKDAIRLRSREMLLVLLLLLGVLAVSFAAAITAVAGNAVSRLLPGSAEILKLGSFGFSLTILVFLFLLVHKYVPDVHLSWRNALLASFCTATLFTLGKELVVFYLLKSSVSSAFGPGQSVIALLLWAYFSACVVFLGAEFAAAWAVEEAHRSASSAPPLTSERRLAAGDHPPASPLGSA